MLKKLILFLTLIVLLFSANCNIASAQKVGFLSSKMIREHLPDAKIAEQRVQTMVEEWKRELASMDAKIDAMEFEIKKNRLIWSDNERANKEKEYADAVQKRRTYAKEKFESDGEYDKIVREVMKPIEEKIYAAVQQVATKEKCDIVWDQSKQPLAYVNFKYDITLKVLKTLGVEVEALEKEQDEKIKNDPRNQESTEKSKSQKTRRRSRTATKQEANNEQNPKFQVEKPNTSVTNTSEDLKITAPPKEEEEKK